MDIRAQYIEAKMAELRLTKKALAARCGISAQNISTIVRRGRRSLRLWASWRRAWGSP